MARFSILPTTARTWLTLAAVCVAPAAQQPGDELQEHVRSFQEQFAPFAKRHCFTCHGNRRQRGDLNLEALTPRFDAGDLPLWTRLYDRIESGEMPPKKRRRPPADSVQSVLGELAAGLEAADLLHRSSVRRLNRTEYENTIRDLLQVDVRVQHMLPEDGSAHGFDNVGSALAISTELMTAYLDAATAAVDAAIATGPEPKYYREKLDLRGEARKAYGLVLLEKEDGVAVFTCVPYVPTEFPFETELEGRYRMKISAYAWRSDEPLVMEVRIQNWKARKKGLIGYYEVGAEPQTVEITHRLEPGDKVKIVPYRLRMPPRQDPAEYDGPGIVVQGMEIEGPLRESWPPPSHRALFGDLDTTAATLDDARRILAQFAPRAFRRPVSEDELAPFVRLAEERMAGGRSFVDSLSVALRAVLCSPSFLFLGDPERGPTEPMGGRELAVRLAYFLWSSMPDDALLADAAELAEPEVMARHVERMLASPKARAFTENFVGQWLDLREIEFTSPDEALYPEFDELLQVSMVEETERFFGEVLDRDLSLLSFLDSDFSMLNSRLAEHYGIPGVEGLEFRRTELPDGARRGGVLTHASVLKVTANGTYTSPVLRGAWFLENILDDPSRPPPAGVAAIEPDTRGATTVREQLDLHRNDASCSTCHQKIDPPGFALESFDAIGGWRDHYRSMGDGEAVDRTIDGAPVEYKRGLPVDASGETAGGRPFQGIDEFKRHLLDEPEVFARSLTRKLLTYARGHELGFGDRATVDRIVERVRASNYGFRTLVHEVAKSLSP